MNKTLFAAAMAFSVASAVQAAPQLYFGEDQSPGASVVPGRAPATARAAFLGELSGGVSNEGFERFAAGSSAPLALSFAGSGGSSLAATLTGSGAIRNSSTVGRFNTTSGGSNWWDVQGSFKIEFAAANAISAFGFYGSDIGDFSGQVTIDLTDIAGATSRYVVSNTPNGNDGALLFWGFVDKGNKYTSITFGNTNAGVDGFGFDDMVVGDLAQVGGGGTPEPGTLALVGLALGGLALTSRRRRTRD